MPTALVTGANGAIGRHTVAYLVEQGWTVGGLGYGPVNWAGHSPIDYWIAAEVSSENLDVIVEHIGRPEIVINLAGGSSVGPSLQTPLNDFEMTMSSIMRLLNWIWTRSPNSKLVAVSSAAVYGNRHGCPIEEGTPLAPMSPYGHHKAMLEQAVRYWGAIFGLSAVIARPFSVYGVGLHKQLVFDLCRRLAPRPKRLVLSGTGKETRDWIDIRDVARILVDLSAFATPATPSYNLCSGSSHSVADVADLLAELCGGGTEIAFDGSVRPGDPVHLKGNDARIREIGLQSRISLRDGISAVAAAAWHMHKQALS